MYISKEKFREFESKKLIFLTGPDGNQGQEALAAQDLAETSVEFAETPHMDKVKAIETADQTKMEGVAAVKQAAEDPEQTIPFPEGTEITKPISIEDLTATSFIHVNPKYENAGVDGQEVPTSAPNPEAPLSVEQTPANPAEAEKAAPEGVKVSPDEVATALYNDRDIRLGLLNFIDPNKDFSKITEAEFAKLIKENKDFSKVLDSVTKDEKGEFNLDNKGRLAFGKAIEKRFGIEGMKPASKEEMKRIGEVKIGKKETLEGVYGREVVQMLSMKYEIRQAKGGPVEVKLEGDKWVALNAETISILLPTDVANAYDKKKEKGGEEAYKKLIETKLKGIQSAMAFKELIAGNEGKGQLPNSIWKMLRSGLQILQIITKALKTGDFEDFTDAMADAKNHKDIGESRKSASEEYKKQIDPIKDPNILLAMHANPHGGKAAQMFGESENAIPYRSELKAVVEGKIASSFGEGVTINNFVNENGKTSFRMTQSGENYDVFLNPGDTFTKAKIVKVDIGENGKETFGNPIEKNITDLDDLKGMLNEAKKGLKTTPEVTAVPPPENPTPDPKAETPEKKAGAEADKKPEVQPEKKPETPAAIG